MLSDRAYLALADLDNGARLNCVHSVARELIAAGLAIDEWGFLRLTEAGRQVGRGKLPRSLVIQDGNVADLSYRIDPMANPVTAAAQMATPPALAVQIEAADEIVTVATVALDPTTDETVRAYRAAGVATGKTQIEVDAKWVIAFVEAWSQA